MDLIKEIKQIFQNYNFNTQILVASIRHPQHVVDAGKIGADVVTVPAAVLGKMLNHTLTDKGLKAFLADWEKLKTEKPNVEIKKIITRRTSLIHFLQAEHASYE